MKLITLVLVALLSIFTWAAPSRFAGKDIELPPGVYIRDGEVIIDNPPPASGETGELEDLAEEDGIDHDQLPPFPNGTGSFITTNFGEPIYYPPPPTDANSFASSTTSSSNGSMGAFASGDRPLVDLRMGGLKVHVGTLRKKRMHDAIISCLEAKCKVQDCFEPEPFKGMTCIVPNIVYNAGGNKYTVKDSKLSITIRAIHKSSAHPDLDAVARDTIATMYQIMTEEPDNCFNIDFKGSRRTTLCTVAQQTLVAFPVVEGSKVLDAFYVVSLNYNKKIDSIFNGKSALGTVRNWFTDNGKARVATAVGIHRDDMNVRVNWVEKQCFLPNYWWDCNKGLDDRIGS
ncbi:hypothetical protein T440DRAFT_522506 [Plenodomus tracheiphilus IPT5]|uniref:Uncharacterized protein n=1 Tax=Plenodomus tracheiphilus IPT5 TaxID=1408161 RepID=A0A6A7AQT9_9PLEO|nr:hypothetical protein T440DRAFT_522506 [Plenodomus tracheiphilus IPT5]